MENQRFKIDFRPGYTYAKFGLFFRRRRLFSSSWDLVDAFDSVEKCKDCYEQIKDLPQYLA